MSLGVYTIEQAAQLVQVDARTISRWFAGPSAVFVAQRWGSDVNLSFRELVSAYVLNQFRKQFGFSLQFLRYIAAEAQRELADDRPFSVKRFVTDGKTILLRVGEGAEDPADERHQLLDLRRRQLVIRSAVEPLLREVDYQSDIAARWWPCGRRGGVVVDPQRHFGEPVLNRSGVPTRVIYGPFASGTKRKELAGWFGISLQEIGRAIDFEQRMQPKAA